MKSDDTLVVNDARPDEIDEPPVAQTQEAPLVGTLRFVFVMGITFSILWLGMYVLLRERW